ncbi:MAG TPA: transcriptional regulator [Myxococcales bacterium]|nr:transcriptional regulator [Myxococcales bacterium]
MLMYSCVVSRAFAAKRSRLSDERVTKMARAFKALSDPTRLRLIGAILDEERCVHDLCEELELEQSAASHQLRILRNQNLVRTRKAGRHVYYRLDDEHIRSLFETALTHVAHTGKGDR